MHRPIGGASPVPVVIAVGVFGVSFGVLAGAAGMSPWVAVAMSATVFAGSAQFAAVSLLGGAGSWVAAVVSGVLLNLRYLATGAAAAPVLRGSRLRRLIAAQLVIDESYALAAGPNGLDGPTLMRSGAALWMAWVLGTAVGAFAGPLAGDPARIGLDAAFPALFVALVWPMLGSAGARRAAIAGVVTALVLDPFVPAGVPLAVAAAVGLIVHR